ncbi:hypothetical protein DNTS_015718 [Danionella cerebrum]|uniref:RRM domain-containing protein n=1 Tax=Danionella cerebrum TaxID=2873325 RepID=A0A553QD22_9TELE|nr:hypothetical protein DNTS_015718 [Danionella translucida]
MELVPDMSTEEMDNESLGYIENLTLEINKSKAQHEAIMKEQQIQKDGIRSNIDFAQKFRQRAEQVKKSNEQEIQKNAMKLQNEKKKCRSIEDKSSMLKKEILKIQEELQNLDSKNKTLKKQTEISTAVPERKVVYEGKTKVGAHDVSFDMNSRIVYPMQGGTTLITFEEEDVAQKILSMKEHLVSLGDCTIKVQAKPVHFLVPFNVEMETEVCPHRILVSNLPKDISEERTLDKLDIHFSKARNGGGEVLDKDMLHDSSTVVITFQEDNVAKHLSDKQDHEVDFGKQKYKVKVTPFLNGKIIDMKISNSTCSRTVLLTGIPDIMDKEDLQDNLEIHFQKTTNGGGEVESILYNPVGHSSLALFQQDTPEDSQNA